MDKIIGTQLVTNSEVKAFVSELQNAIKTHQESDREVDIHYSTSILGNHLLHSALIILRKL